MSRRIVPLSAPLPYITIDVSDVSDVSDVEPTQPLDDDDEVQLAPRVEQPLLQAPRLERRNAMVRPLDPIPFELDDDEDIIINTPVPAAQVRGRGPNVMRWCVTWNNPTTEGDEVAQKLKANDNIKGFVFQLEKGESGTPHFQMYIEFKKSIYFTGVQTALGTKAINHVKAAGTKEQNIKYCTKEEGREAGPWLYGTCTNNGPGQGKRNDLDKFAQAVSAAGEITDDIKEEYHGHVLRYGHLAEQMIEREEFRKAERLELAYWKEQIERKRRGESFGQEPRKLVLLFGPSAVGKTTHAKMACVEEADELPYMKQGTSNWWCHYKGHKNVIVDEWQIKLTGNLETFNDMTNKGMYMAQRKGGQVILMAEAMYFTSNRHPMDIFKTRWNDPRYRAMTRRFAEVHWWNDDKELVILKNPGAEPESCVCMRGGEHDESLSREERIAECNLEKFKDWNDANVKWVHFWRRMDRPVQEGDSVDGEEEYFTW